MNRFIVSTCLTAAVLFAGMRTWNISIVPASEGVYFMYLLRSDELGADPRTGSVRMPYSLAVGIPVMLYRLVDALVGAWGQPGESQRPRSDSSP